MKLFGRKGKKTNKEVPTERVRALASEGKNDREIISQLKTEGYSNTQISSALNRVLKFKVSGAPQGPEPITKPMGPPPSSPQKTGLEFVSPSPQEFNSAFLESQPATEGEPEQVLEMQPEEEISLEELIEEIIEEKWKDIESRLEDYDKRIEGVIQEINMLKGKMSTVENKHDKTRKDMEEKIDETYTHIEGIESRIGSIEKAFKEFLPGLTENVHALSGIVQKFKSQSKLQPPTEPEKE